MKAVSLDFFDTLAYRQVPELSLIESAFEAACSQHDITVNFSRFLVFREQAYSQLCAQNESQGGDKETGLLALYTEVFTLANHSRPAYLAQIYCNNLVFLESQNLRLNPNVNDSLNAINQLGINLLVTSDTPYSSQHLDVFLSALGINQLIRKVYASSDQLSNKASGRLFDIVLQQEGLQSSEVIHLGDNPLSDVRRATEKGIQAVHYVKQTHAVNDTVRQEQALKEFGYRVLGPVMYVFANWLKQKQTMPQKLLFLARDSYLIHQVYALLFPDDNSDYLYLNRVMANQLSTSTLSQETLNYINRHHKADGLMGLVKAYGLYESPFSQTLELFVERNSLAKDTLISSELSQSILHNRALCESFAESLNARRINTLAYINTFIQGAELTSLVDLGWRGSIFTSIASHFGSLQRCYLLCCVSAPDESISALSSVQSEFTRTLSQYRDLLEWSLSEDKGACLYIDDEINPVHGQVQTANIRKKHLVQSGIRDYVEAVSRNELKSLNNQQALLQLTTFLNNLPEGFHHAFTDVEAEIGIDGGSGVSFSNMLKPIEGKKVVSGTEDAMKKQAFVGRFLDLVDQLKQRDKLVLYGAGTGFELLHPFIAEQVNWIVDINRQLEGKQVRGISIKHLDSLSSVEQILVVTVIGRKRQIMPLLEELDCEIVFLEDYL